MLYTASHIARKIRQVAILLAATGLPAASGKIEPPAEPVSVYLNVEKDGALVTGLTHANFRVYQDGKAQEFRLAPLEEPASIGLLVEYSASSGYFLEDLAAALEGFGQHAADGHWYALATYSRNLEIQVDFTRQIGEIGAAFSRMGTPLWSEINTYDAVYEMLDKMGKLPGRRVLIVIGSGFDTFSEHTLQEVQRKAEAENVAIFVAGLGSIFRGVYDPYLGAGSRLNFAQAQAFLQMLANKSGGFAWFPNQFSVFHDVLEGVMQSIATQYRLVYDAPAGAPGKFRKLKVEAFRIVNDKRENFKVLAREGWR